MTNKTQIAELRLSIAKARDNWTPEIKIHPVLLEEILDQLEAAEAHIVELESSEYRRRATKAEQENALLRKELNAKPNYEWFVNLVRSHLGQAESVPVQHLGVQVKQLKESHDGWKPRAEKAEARIAELERHVVSLRGIRDVLKYRTEKAEAELAAIRGGAVPVAWAPTRWLDTRCKLSVWTDRNSAVLAIGDNSAISELFTHPAPPVVALPDEILTCLVALGAAISLLEKVNKKAAPSDKFFDLMLNDFRNALVSGAAVFHSISSTNGEEE
ncbi:hypothetical protein [Rouxiella sp. WC2420]|uniref:Uncharacterized protein n=1 Tax=Rouxiella sp. WC2420 TaxID=3234145 RepID=A0AB39VL82_9GAMM